MALNQLSAIACKNAKATEREYLLADGNGLFLRVRPDSTKGWLLVYSMAGKRRKLGLGAYPAITLETAREEAGKARQSIAGGNDPGIAKQEKAKAQEQRRAEAAARLTVQQLFDRWSAVDLIRHKDGGQHVKDTMNRHVLPHIGSMYASDVRKGHVTGVTDALLAAGKQRTAKVCLSLMRQMFRYAVDRDVLEFDPTAALRKAAVGGKDVERDRVLTDDEIRALHRILPAANLKKSTEHAIWLALSTCCRIGEILTARWSDVDLEKKIWRIQDTKNGKPHVVHLSDFALHQFEAIRAADTDTAWVFPNRDASDHVCPKTVTKQIGDRQRPGLPPMRGRAKADLADTLVLTGGNWTPHDLRRTGATLMVALGVLPEVAERCLNHVEQNRVKRIYQRHSYETEMRDAWRLLGERLDLLTSATDNIVILKKA